MNVLSFDLAGSADNIDNVFGRIARRIYDLLPGLSKLGSYIDSFGSLADIGGKFLRNLGPIGDIVGFVMDISGAIGNTIDMIKGGAIDMAAQYKQTVSALMELGKGMLMDQLPKLITKLATKLPTRLVKILNVVGWVALIVDVFGCIRYRLLSKNIRLFVLA